MRTRLAITSMLCIGVLLMSTGGAAMALSGESSSGSAGTAQYAPAHHHTNHLVIHRNNTTPPASVRQTQQLSTPADGSTLPFTGLLMIPLIVLGVAMLIVGLVMRRRTMRAPNH